MNSSKKDNDNKTWSDGFVHEKSPRRPRSEPTREYINPVARALHDNETWTIDDNGDFQPTIPYSIVYK